MPKCLWKEGRREGNALLLREISIRVCKGNPLLHVVDSPTGKGFARENVSVDFEEVCRHDLLILGEERGRGQGSKRGLEVMDFFHYVNNRLLRFHRRKMLETSQPTSQVFV